ncbi:MAG: Rieske (2Fe-2S) protein [Bryobacteraceae bacterium]
MAEGRRSVIRWVLGGGITASIVSFLYPALRFMSPPEIPEAAVDEVNAGKAAELKPNSAKIVKFGSRPVLLIRLDETKWRAFSAVCTHLNCTVQFLDTGHRIWCACHNGFYDLSGRVISGPPPRPLEEYTVHVRGEEVIISRHS